MTDSIVVAQLCDEHYFTPYVVNNPVLVINPSRPKTGERMFQWLRFPDARERRSQNVFNQHIDPLESTFVGSLPV